MKPGRELDALVAERVMGLDGEIACEQHGHILAANRPKKACTQILGKWEFKGTCPKCGWAGRVSKTLRSYSTDIAAAWDVLPVLEAKDLYLQLWAGGPDEPRKWNAQFQDKLGITQYFAYADNAPRAICLAALKAVDGK